MKKIINNFVAFKLLEGLALSFFFATYSLFLRQRGLDPLEINLLNGVFMVAVFLLEVPTGAIADFFGRKFSIVVGLFAYSLSFLMYFFSDNFWSFALAEVVGALAMACVSGALEALVVDSLKHHGHTGELENVFRLGELRAVGIAVGALIGGFIGGVDLSYPWLASAIAFLLLALWVMFSFKEEYFVRPKKISINFCAVKTIARDSIIYGLKNRQLMFMMLFLGFLALVYQPFNMYWPLVLKDNFSFPERNMGVIFVLITLFIYLGSQFSKIFQRMFKDQRSAIIFSQVITFVGMMGACFFLQLPLFLSFFILHEFGRGVREPLVRAYINNQIDSKNRATVLSLQSMIVHLGAGIGLIFSGIIAKNFGFLSAWFINAVILIIVIIVFYKKR